MESTIIVRWLRAEGAAALLIATVLYAVTGGSWLLFVILFFVPDLGMLGYLRGPAVGAAIYNALHSYALPALLAAAGILLAFPLATAIALIWVAHIGFDRMLGYGLKRPTAFGDTHLGRIGRQAAGA